MNRYGRYVRLMLETGHDGVAVNHIEDKMQVANVQCDAEPVCWHRAN